MRDDEEVDATGTRAPRVFILTLALLTLGLPIATGELFLRWRGYEPWRPLARGPYQPPLGEADAELLWRNKPGHHVYPAYDGNGEIEVTIDETGRRSTGPAPEQPAKRVMVFGDSITFGYAISDSETFAWKLQRRFPDVELANYGVPGYGTYQSLLMMRRILANASADLVLYGFYNDHLQRNIQTYAWVTIQDRNTRGVIPPYCTVDRAGRLLEHPSERVSRWPFREYLSSAYFLEQAYVRRTVARRDADAWPVVKQLVRRMQESASEHGARFALVFLMSRPGVTRPLTEFLRADHIAFANCERKIRPGWTVPVEGHPNGLMNDEWASCLADALPGLLAGSETR